MFFNESAGSIGTIDAGQARSNDQIITLAGGQGIVDRKDLAALRAMMTGLGCYLRMTPGEEAEILAATGRHWILLAKPSRLPASAVWPQPLRTPCWQGPSTRPTWAGCGISPMCFSPVWPLAHRTSPSRSC